VIVLDAAVKTMVGLDAPQALRDSSPNPWVRAFFSRQPSEPATATAGGAA